ncbi:MAG: hypothetical protein ACOCRK_06750 [bacterium]
MIVASLIDTEIPIYVPENGFIGINIPLTDSRNGSCSTRTTHPYFIDLFNELLTELGINNSIINIYKKKSKGEILEEIKNNELIQNFSKETISCSHPCQIRFLGENAPQNCGYCYPCLIRRAAMYAANIQDCDYVFDLNKELINTDKGSDFRALLLSLKKYLNYKDDKSYLNNLLLKTGKLTVNNINNYKRIYVKTMEEIYSMIKTKGSTEVINYLGK